MPQYFLLPATQRRWRRDAQEDEHCFPMWGHGKGLGRAGAAEAPPVLACRGLLCTLQWPGHKGSRGGLVLGCPQGMIYLMITDFLEESGTESLSVNKPGTEYVNLTVFTDSWQVF